MSWRRLSRKSIYETAHLSLYEDTVEILDGHKIDDYSVVALPDGVCVVATDEEENIITFHEYKYAADKTLLTFPAGGWTRANLRCALLYVSCLKRLGMCQMISVFLVRSHPIRLRSFTLITSLEQKMRESFKGLSVKYPKI